MSKLLLYCTKAKKQKDLLWSNNLKHFFLDGAYNRLIDNLPEYLLNGKIVAECDFEVEEIIKECVGFFKYCYRTKTLDEYDLMFKTQLDGKSMNEYLQGNGYAIHIKNLHIFDEPKELSDYYKFDGIYNDINNWKTIDKAPQNMMYAYDLISELGFSGTYNMHLKKNILISIQPQWMCLILNRIKDVEVRRKVLKEMLGK